MLFTLLCVTTLYRVLFLYSFKRWYCTTFSVATVQLVRPWCSISCAVFKQLSSGDKLLVTKLDRFARSAAQGSQLIESLIENGVTVHVLNIGIMDNTPTGKLIRNIMLSFAEFERDMIVERTQEGKAIARGKGLRVDGRPKIDISTDILRKFLKKQKDGLLTVKECCEELEICRSTWYNLTKELS